MTPDGAATPGDDGAKRPARRAAIPAMMPALFFSTVSTPAAFLGYRTRTRGLMAPASRRRAASGR